ncbi:MAG: hypothetical protein ACC707_04435 [Thiohalomonadales bacterium]
MNITFYGGKMGFLDRIFNKNDATSLSIVSNKSFVECVQIVNAWKTRAAIDPDVISPDDAMLNSAFHSQVRCPYCSSDIKFEDAIINSGVKMRIRCPVCQTEPDIRINN